VTDHVPSTSSPKVQLWVTAVTAKGPQVWVSDPLIAVKTTSAPTAKFVAEKVGVLSRVRLSLSKTPVSEEATRSTVGAESTTADDVALYAVVLPVEFLAVTASLKYAPRSLRLGE
jgi:hypothetical protein